MYKYYFDFDDVLVLTSKLVIEILNEKFNKSLTPQEVLAHPYHTNIQTCYHPSVSWEDICKEYDTYANVEFTPGALDFLRTHVKETLIVTKTQDAVIAGLKDRRIEAEVPGLNVLHIPYDVPKRVVNMHKGFFTDDAPHNFVQTNAAATFHFSPYGVPPETMKWVSETVTNFEDLIKKFEEYEQKYDPWDLIH